MTAPFKMGRVRPRVRPHLLHLNNYLTVALPPAPVSVDYTGSLATKKFLAEILGNDTLGDCTCAGVVHIAGVWQAGAGEPITVNVTDALTLYEQACGYVPGNPGTDQGGDEQTVLDYVKAHGLGQGDDQVKLTAWARVAGDNAEQVRTAVYLFENVYFGVELPDAWVSPMPQKDGFVWDVAGDPDPDNGHCFVGLGYDAEGVIVDSWGLIGKITWAAIAKYATTPGSGELYTLFSPNSVMNASQRAPNGFSALQLAADIQGMD